MPGPDPVDARSLAVLLVWLVVACTAGWVTPFAAVLAAGGRAAADASGHWTERARRRWPVRTTLTFALLIVPACAGAAGAQLVSDLVAFPPRAAGVLSGIAALLGFSLAAARTSRRFRDPAPGVRALLAEWAVFALLFWTAYVVVIAAAVAMPAVWGTGPPLVLLAALVLLVLLAAGGISTLLVVLGLAEHAPQEVAERVRAAGARVGVTPRRVLVVDAISANAAVLPLPRDVLLFRPVLAFPPQELDAVLAHEMGHLTEGRLVACARLLPAIAILPAAALLPLGDALGLGWALAVVLVPLLSALSAGRIVRALEARADDHAHAHENEDPARAGAYAAALLRLAEHNLTPAVQAGRTHPDLWDRVVAAGVQPDFPRPAPPSRTRQRLGILAAVAACMTVLIAGAALVATVAVVSR